MKKFISRQAQHNVVVTHRFEQMNDKNMGKMCEWNEC